MSDYGMAAMRDKIISRCAAGGNLCLNEDSCSCKPQTWWYHSRVGAWDCCHWAPKQFHDFHVEWIKDAQVREADMLEMQMGWWAPLLGDQHYPCHKLDDMEYYASRNAGLDASMSISDDVDVARRTLDFHSSRMMTVLGWYERARRAKAFAPGVREAFDCKGAEFRLRQDPVDGVWKVASSKPLSFRAGSRETASRSFTLASRPRRAVLRVEALFSGEVTGGRNAFALTKGVWASAMKISTANGKVSIRVDETAAEDGVRAFRFSAANDGAKARGAWARATAAFSPYLDAGDRRVLRFKVKGDGSGALLNVQVEAPREYGQAFSEHYVTLDFTGWRDFTMPFRERDAARYPDCEWPYKGYSAVFHRRMRGDHISAVNFYLNEIPAGGSATAEVSDVAIVPLKQTKAVAHAVSVNGKSVAVPFETPSGCFAELDDGVWTLYSADGEPMERKATGDAVELVAGRNDVSYGGRCEDGALPRAEVTVFALGESRPALSDVRALPSYARRHLVYEAAEPQFYAPQKGFGELAPLAMRPGEEVEVEVVVYGPMPACSLSIGGVATALPAVDRDEHRKFHLNGRHAGVRQVRVVADDAAPIAARFEFVKRYTTNKQENKEQTK